MCIGIFEVWGQEYWFGNHLEYVAFKAGGMPGLFKRDRPSRDLMTAPVGDNNI